MLNSRQIILLQNRPLRQIRCLSATS